MNIRPSFTPAFFKPESSSNLASTQAQRTPHKPPVLFSNEKYCGWRQFKAHPDFKTSQKEYIDLIDSIVKFFGENTDKTVPPQTSATVESIRKNFAELKENLSDRHVVWSKGTLYGYGKKQFHQLENLLENETIPLQKRMNAVMAMAPQMENCAGGVLTALGEAISSLDCSTTIKGQARHFKIQMIDALIAQHVTNTHEYRPEMEVHFVNAYFNHLAKDMGVPERTDELISIAKDLITTNQLERCRRKVLAKFKPAALSRAMAENYLDKIKGAVVDHIDKTKGAQQIDINGSFQGDQAVDVFNEAKDMEAILKSEFGEVSQNNYLLPDDDTFSSFHFARQPTLVAKHFMEELKKNGLVNYDDVISLTAGDNGEIKMLGDLFWRDNGGRCEELLKAQELLDMSPQMIMQKLKDDKVAPEKHGAILQGVVQHILDACESENIANVPDAWLKALAGLLDQKQISKDEMVPAAMLAVAFNGKDALKALIKKTRADINAKNEQGVNAAILAAQNGYANELKALSKAGADLSVRNERGFTLPMIATWNGHTDVLEVLFKASPNIIKDPHPILSQIAGTRKDSQGPVLAQLAACNGKAGVLDFLLKVDPGLIHTKGRAPENLTLVQFAVRGNHADALKVLVKADPTLINATDKDGVTAVMLAADKGHTTPYKS